MKLFKNRTVLGIFCIAVSLLICFAITPLINSGLSKKAINVNIKMYIFDHLKMYRFAYSSS